MIGADGQITVGQLFVAGPAILAAVTGYLAFRASRKRDETATAQADRKVALEEFNAINAMKQQMVDDLKDALEDANAEVEAGLKREEQQDEAYRKLQRRCDEEKFSYQNQIFMLQRQLDKIREGNGER